MCKEFAGRNGFCLRRYKEVITYADQSEWVSFIDHDDLIAPTMYEEMMRFVRKQNIDMVCIRGEDKTEEQMKNPKWGKRMGEAYVLDGKTIKKVLDASSVSTAEDEINNEIKKAGVKYTIYKLGSSSTYSKTSK